jgi:hypothetical protein
MRSSTVSTPGGSADYHTVHLSPSNWCSPFFFPKTVHRSNPCARAWLALQKGMDTVPKARTVEWYTWEISKLNSMLEVLRYVGHYMLDTSSCFLTLLP